MNNLVQKLLKEEDFNVAHTICKNGHIQMARFFKAKSSPKDFNLNFSDEVNQTCLHYAVARNRFEFAQWLLGSEEGRSLHSIHVN